MDTDQGQPDMTAPTFFDMREEIITTVIEPARRRRRRQCDLPESGRGGPRGEGLPDVNVLAVDDCSLLRVHIELRDPSRCCPVCGQIGGWKERRRVELVDLACLGRPVRLVWHKHRWTCRNPVCGRGSWTSQDAGIAPVRGGMTVRAGRWVTIEVGRDGRTVSEVARELDCDWHTVNDTVIAYGAALLDADTSRIGEVTALGLDETLFMRSGRWRTQGWATSIVVVVNSGTLLDMVPGRDSTGAARWLEAMPTDWRAQVRFGVLDLSGPYRAVFNTALSHVVQVADPFHLIRLANDKLDECRRRVQNETLGHYAGDVVKRQCCRGGRGGCRRSSGGRVVLWRRRRLVGGGGWV